MNKKLVKTRNARLNTLEAMACSCGCGCDCDCTNCSAGGSFKLIEKSNIYSSRNSTYRNGAVQTAFVRG